jgi:hypothetical protein
MKKNPSSRTYLNVNINLNKKKGYKNKSKKNIFLPLEKKKVKFA